MTSRTRTASGHMLWNLDDAKWFLPIQKSIYHEYNTKPSEERSKIFEQLAVSWAYLAIQEAK